MKHEARYSLSCVPRSHLFSYSCFCFQCLEHSHDWLLGSFPFLSPYLSFSLLFPHSFLTFLPTSPFPYSFLTLFLLFSYSFLTLSSLFPFLASLFHLSFLVYWWNRLNWITTLLTIHECLGNSKRTFGVMLISWHTVPAYNTINHGSHVAWGVHYSRRIYVEDDGVICLPGWGVLSGAYVGSLSVQDRSIVPVLVCGKCHTGSCHKATYS